MIHAKVVTAIGRTASSCGRSRSLINLFQTRSPIHRQPRILELGAVPSKIMHQKERAIEREREDTPSDLTLEHGETHHGQ